MTLLLSLGGALISHKLTPSKKSTFSQTLILLIELLQIFMSEILFVKKFQMDIKKENGLKFCVKEEIVL
jgi:hypothetical protein